MSKFSQRQAVISAIFISVFCIYIIRLFYMQVIDNSFEMKAIQNSQRIITEYPARGLIYDRNGVLLVENQPAYDLMVIPKQVKKFDTTELISILGIDKDFLEKALQKARRYSTYKSSVLLSQVTADKYAVLQEKLYKYNGFYIQTRTLRKYNIAHSADVFGYIGEVDAEQIKKDSSYSLGDYIGTAGLEKSYEKVLKGEKGEKVFLVDNYNRIKGSYKDGLYDKPAVVGGDLTTTLDIELQEYAYQLMQNKRGGIIAIEPSTGEILLKVSAPGYDPQLMVGMDRGKNYNNLIRDTINKPLFDRTIMSNYPPGSTFKVLQALVGLQEQVVTPESRFECHGGYMFGSLRMRCHNHPSPLDLRHSIQHSCNPYYVQVWRRILENKKYESVRDAYGEWRKYIMSFGLGQKLCADFTNEVSGSIPTQEAFDQLFKTQNWRWSFIMSLSIGQGELLMTPLQLANMAAVVANRGYYMTPHIVRPSDIVENKIEKHTTPIDSKYFEIAVDGMELAVKNGTARNAMIDSAIVCGKTGTVQNPHGADHSVFMAFAPKDNPKIAIAVYIENGEWGATYAAPIAGLVMEKYITGRIAPRKQALEKRMLEANLIGDQSSDEKNNE